MNLDDFAGKAISTILAMSMNWKSFPIRSSVAIDWLPADLDVYNTFIATPSGATSTANRLNVGFVGIFADGINSNAVALHISITTLFEAKPRRSNLMPVSSKTHQDAVPGWYPKLMLAMPDASALMGTLGGVAAAIGPVMAQSYLQPPPARNILPLHQ
jgi:hypothetical protein